MATSDHLVRVDRQTLLMQVITTRRQVDLASCSAILNNLVQACPGVRTQAGKICRRRRQALAAVLRGRVDTVRADIMKQVLILQV